MFALKLTNLTKIILKTLCLVGLLPVNENLVYFRLIMYPNITSISGTTNIFYYCIENREAVEELFTIWLHALLQKLTKRIQSLGGKDGTQETQVLFINPI